MKQEEGHKKKLEGVLSGKVDVAKIEKVPNLKVSDYMVDGELRPDIPYADILRIAMKREERSVKLYTDLKERSQDAALNNLFTFLVQEESKHKYYLESSMMMMSSNKKISDFRFQIFKSCVRRAGEVRNSFK